MPTFTVSLIASIPVSAQVVVEADNEADAIALANQMHSQARLGWTYNGLPIPAFNGPVASVWSSPGVVPGPGPKKTTVTLAVTPTVVQFGSNVAATATIQPGATGLVSFYDGNTLLGAATPDGLGVATLSNISLPIGTQQIVAKFAGDLYLAPATSNTVNVLVQAPPTQTALSASPNSQFFGQDVALMATVTADSGTPDGLVIFFDGGAQIGSAALSGGTCTFHTTSLSAGDHQLTAGYQGSTNFAPSTSPVVRETILLTATTTSVLSSIPNANFGQLVVFTASVNSIDGPPTSGTVHFLAIPTSGPTVDLGITGVDNTGHAAVSSSTLLVGTYTIQATYSGNSNFQGSQGTTPQAVATDPTTTMVVSSSPTAVVGTLVTWTATVTSAFGTVNAGSVAFIAIPGEGPSTNLGTQTVDGTGHASVSSSSLPTGNWTIQASYSGTSSFGASVGTTSQRINANTATIVVTDSPIEFNTLFTGGLTLRATLNGTGPTPTGTVSFYAAPSSLWPGGAAPIPGASGINIVGGVASVTIPSTSINPGVYTISCTYSGDGNYTPEPVDFPTTGTLTVIDPFNIVTSSQASTSGSTLTDTSVNFLAGAEYTVQNSDQVVFTATGNTYQITAVGTHSLTLQTVGVGGVDGGPIDASDLGSNLSYKIESSNIAPNQFWRLASNPPGTYNDWAVHVQTGTAAPTPTGTMFFHYFQPEFTHASYWVQLGQISGVTNNGGLIQISTASFLTPAGDTLNLPHGLKTGEQAVISGVVGVPANGTWTVTVIDSVTFTLNGSVFSGAYSSGGTVAHVMSGGTATYHMDEGGTSPWGGGSAILLSLSACYNGDGNYSASPNPNNQGTLPTNAPALGAVHMESAG